MKDFISKLLNGMSIGIVIALIPSALLGELLKLLIPHFPSLQGLLDITTYTMSLMPIMIGVMVGIEFKLTPIQIGSVAIASMVGSGVVQTVEGGFLLKGIGITVNIGITAALAVLFVKLLGNKLKGYSMLLMPTLSILIPGLIGYLIFPYVRFLMLGIGNGIGVLTTLQPVIMGALIAMIFCVIIISPISSVGVATAIMLSGIGAGAANLGIVAAGMGLAIASYKSNSLGTALVHVLGSPKVQMRNFLMKPKIALPMILTAAVLGGLAGILNIQGTPISAGFGLSGLVGPLNYINLAGGWSAKTITIMIVAFFIVPFVVNYLLIKLFARKFKLIKAEDYKLNFE